MNRPSRTAMALLCLAALPPALAGCTQSAAIARSHASAAAAVACRQRADQVYDRQNRADVYRSDTYETSTRDSPFASTGLPGVTTAGLSSRYQYAQLQDDCLNNSGSGAAPPSGPQAGPAGSPMVQ